MSLPVPEADTETLDSIGTSGVRVYQRRQGYRFTVDALLLAHFAAAEADPQADLPWLELGAGSGVISLLLAHQFGVTSLNALELLPGPHSRMVRSIALNGHQARVHPWLGDLRSLPPPLRGIHGQVVSNPPYRPGQRGLLSADEERATGKHELTCDAKSVVSAARQALMTGGGFSLIYPAFRLAEVFRLLEEQRLFPRVLRLIHSRAESPATRFLVHAKRDRPGEISVRAPLIVHGDAPGGYSAELAALVTEPLPRST